MKVTKKVGRRSRKYTSSISRRRFRSKKNSKNKSIYKKRYGKTHRGSARSRKYGHKRGKRFHRGGVNPQNVTSFKCEFTEDPTDGNLKLLIPNKELFFKKNGIFIQGKPSEKFDVTIKIRGSKNKNDSNNSNLVFSVVFSRQTKGSTYGDFVNFFIDNLDFFVNKDKQKKLKKSTEDVYYDFSDERNQAFFTELSECIKKNLKTFFSVVVDILQKSSSNVLNVVIPKNGFTPDELVSLMGCLNEQSGNRQSFSSAYYDDKRKDNQPLLSFLELEVQDPTNLNALSILKTIIPRRNRVAFTDIRNGSTFWKPEIYTTFLQNKLHELVRNLIVQLNRALRELNKDSSEQNIEEIDNVITAIKKLLDFDLNLTDQQRPRVSCYELPYDTMKMLNDKKYIVRTTIEPTGETSDTSNIGEGEQQQPPSPNPEQLDESSINANVGFNVDDAANQSSNGE
jgi:hypothetical protein